MFRRRDKASPQSRSGSPADVYLGLRSQILTLDPTTVGLAGHALWGCVMETGYNNGVATLVCLSDGTTSLYTSTGGGVIGGGAHEQVARANAALLATLSGYLDEMSVTTDDSLPAEGTTVIRALTPAGQRVSSAPENDLGNGRSVLSPVFHAAHAVITELRLIDQAR